MLTLSLERLARHRVFIQNLRFDLKPEHIFVPTFKSAGEPEVNTDGFMFYIDYLDDIGPTLMLMKTYAKRSKSLGHVPDAPRDLLFSAVSREGVKDFTGMYPIDGAVEAWLKSRLGLTP